MANDLNRVMLIGRLGKEPEIRFTGDGKAIANLTIATSEKWKDKQTGQPQEKTEWTRGVAFGKLAEIMRDYLHKGSRCFFEGKLVTRQWDDKDGNKRYTTEVVINNMQMLDNKPAGQQQGGQQQDGYQQPPQQNNAQQNNQAPAQQQGVAPSDNFDGFTDDIPF